MIRDCRAGLPEGWSFFLRQYVPAVRSLLAHYYPDRAAAPDLEALLKKLRQPGAGLFEPLEPSPERVFVAALRQWIVAALGGASAQGIEIDAETLAAALEPFTLTEKLAVWLETMRYNDT